MNWPFELPLPAYQRIYFCNKCGYIGQVGESHPDCDYLAAGSGPFFSQEQVNACITAALQWAAEEVRREVLIELHNRCIPASAAVADAVRSRVRSILLPKKR